LVLLLPLQRRGIELHSEGLERRSAQPAVLFHEASLDFVVEQEDELVEKQLCETALD
jgi:hypothetical protein